MQWGIAVLPLLMDPRLNMPSEICQFRLNWITANGDTANNILYMHEQTVAAGVGHDVSFDDAGADAQAHKLAQAFGTAICPALSTQVAIGSVDWCWNPVVGTGPLHEGTHVENPIVGGTVTGGSLPMGIAKNLEFKTGLGGRGNHGRIFLIGIPESFLTPGADPDVVNSTGMTALNTAAAGFLAAVNNNNLLAGVGQTWNLVVASFKLHGALRPVTVHHDVTQVLIPNNWLQYQRRRALGHARHH